MELETASKEVHQSCPDPCSGGWLFVNFKIIIIGFQMLSLEVVVKMSAWVKEWIKVDLDGLDKWREWEMMRG